MAFSAKALALHSAGVGSQTSPLFSLPAPLAPLPVQSLRASTRGIRASAGASGEGLPADSSSAVPPPRNSQSGMRSSASEQPGVPPEQPGASSSAQPVSTDPLWKDVFPEYLRNRESDARHGVTVGTPASTRPLLPDRGGSMDGLGPGFRSQSMTSYAMAVPADASMPRYMREPAVRNDPIWAAIRAEARLEAEQEPILSSFLYASILAHDCFERSLGFVLANRLKNVTLLATQLMDVFDDVLMRADIREAIRADVQAVRDRDPSCRSYSNALLYYKGYHALQSYRIAHALWSRGQQILALALQSRISEVFAVDIHPAARIGRGILMDHGTGVVIGETAVVGDRVSMLQGVTLGGTGKEAGDRHPKVQEGVLIGAGATILGNIVIGQGSMIAAGSLVLKDVPPHSMVAGTPAKVVGTLKEDTPSLTMKHDVTKQYWDDGSSNL